MKDFDIFYFDNNMGNFDKYNPRFVVEQPYTKMIISLLGHYKPYAFSLSKLQKKLKIENSELRKSLNHLLNISAVKNINNNLSLNFPFFTSKDCKIIKKIAQKNLNKNKNIFEKSVIQFSNKLKEIYPNINEKLSLYHILCGKVFDGTMFDFLENQGLLKQSYPQQDNRDYMIIGYENSSYCKKFNSELFCSFNHAKYQQDSLSSFGNADGERVDYFRYFKLREKKKLYGTFLKIDNSLKHFSDQKIVEHSINIVKAIINNQSFEKNIFYNNLKTLKYINDNDTIIVPVFYDYIEKTRIFSNFVFKEIGSIIEKTLVEFQNEVLNSNILCVQHNIANDQLCNELWHIYFGLLNKYFVDKKIVATPQQFKHQGKYLKCVYLSKPNS